MCSCFKFNFEIINKLFFNLFFKICFITQPKIMPSFFTLPIKILHIKTVPVSRTSAVFTYSLFSNFPPKLPPNFPPILKLNRFFWFGEKPFLELPPKLAPLRTLWQGLGFDWHDNDSRCCLATKGWWSLDRVTRRILWVLRCWGRPLVGIVVPWQRGENC